MYVCVCMYVCMYVSCMYVCMYSARRDYKVYAIHLIIKPYIVPKILCKILDAYDIQQYFMHVPCIWFNTMEPVILSLKLKLTCAVCVVLPENI